MTVDFKTLLTVLPHVTSANHPVLFRGRHGIGKSSVVYQFADTVGLPVVERRRPLADGLQAHGSYACKEIDHCGALEVPSQHIEN